MRPGRIVQKSRTINQFYAHTRGACQSAIAVLKVINLKQLQKLNFIDSAITLAYHFVKKIEYLPQLKTNNKI